MNAKFIEYFNKMPKIATLSTTDKDGKVDVAVLGSPRMNDEKTVELLLRKNRTFANLLVNPYAVFAIMEPGKTPPEWKGVRVYLKMTDYQTSGEKLETMITKAKISIGEERAKLIHAAVKLEICEVKALDYYGQDWETSI